MDNPPTAPVIAEHLLTGGRALRRAFLEEQVQNIGGAAALIPSSQRDAPVFLLRRGFAYRSCELLNQRRAIVDLLIPGDIAGLDHIVLGHPVGEFTSAGPVSFCLLSPADIRDLMKENWSVSLRVFALIAEARRRCDRHMAMVMRLDARERIAAFLLETYQRLRHRGLINGMSFNLPLTQEQIADHLGLTLVHVNRTLRRLREERLALLDRHVVIIMNLDGLRDLIRGLPDTAYVPNPMLPELS